MDTRTYRLAVTIAGAYLLLGVTAYLLSRPAVIRGGQILGDANGGTIVAIWIAVGVFVTLAWALPRATSSPDRPGFVSPYVLPAVVGPIALFPLAVLPNAVALMTLAILWPASALPLAVAVSRLARDRQQLVAGSFALAVVSVTLGLATIGRQWDEAVLLVLARYVAVAGIALLPAVALIARSGDTGVGDAASTTDRVLARATVLLICSAPAIAGLFLVLPWDLALVLGIAALLGGSVAARVAVRPLSRIATRANTQRDLAVAATEAERSRLAADLHDGPIQDILLLARRLEAGGDLEGAGLAREIGVDLRELSADLRLPMLDDLGVGPALEWLVGRARRLSGIDVSLRYEAEGRPPPDVELAAFRIAQEAIANAVRHGRPPVMVRCAASGVALSLSIEDAGGARVLESSPLAGAGQFGLLNMQQRAEQIGARLDVRQLHPGGTTVALEWRAVAT